MDVALLLQEAVRLDDVPDLTPEASGAGRIRAKHRPLTDIRELSRALGMWLAYAPSMRNGNRTADPPEDRGNAILSTLPISDVRAVELPGERQRHVALFARLTLGVSDRLAVGVIHFDALAGPKHLWRFGHLDHPRHASPIPVIALAGGAAGAWRRFKQVARR